MIGEVIGVRTDEDGSKITVRSKDSGEEFDLEKMEWTNAKYTLNEKTKEIEETVEGKFMQYPLRLAWAITIHKSQGLTFEHAIIDASHSFTHGQTYVALSRCKTLEGMVLSQPLSREPLSAVRRWMRSPASLLRLVRSKSAAWSCNTSFIASANSSIFIPSEPAMSI